MKRKTTYTPEEEAAERLKALPLEAKYDDVVAENNRLVADNSALISENDKLRAENTDLKARIAQWESEDAPRFAPFKDNTPREGG
jgi:cell division protein FtsB